MLFVRQRQRKARAVIGKPDVHGDFTLRRLARQHPSELLVAVPVQLCPGLMRGISCG